MKKAKLAFLTVTLLLSAIYAGSLVIQSMGAPTNPTITLISSQPSPALSNYTLTVYSSTGGTTNPSPGTHSYSGGSAVTVYPIADIGYTFVDWTLDGAQHFNAGDPQNGNSITIRISSDHEIAAVFAHSTQGAISQTPSPTTTSSSMSESSPNNYPMPSGAAAPYMGGYEYPCPMVGYGPYSYAESPNGTYAYPGYLCPMYQWYYQMYNGSLPYNWTAPYYNYPYLCPCCGWYISGNWGYQSNPTDANSNSMNMTASTSTSKDVYLGGSPTQSSSPQKAQSAFVSSPYPVACLGVAFLAIAPVTWKLMHRKTRQKKPSLEPL